MSASALITLFFQYVNHFFPDTLSTVYYYSSGPIQFALATLIVVFPVYVWAAWYLQKIYTVNPDLKESGVRKWLIYLTLFVSVFMIIGSLISILNSFLSGELTIRFFLKALSVLFVAAVIFSYYLLDIREILTKTRRSVFRYGTIVLVLGLVIGTFFIIGNPAKQRALRMDDLRSQHLSNLKYSIDAYYAQLGKLPETLTNLNEPPYYFGGTVTDPETGAIYEYRSLGAGRMYELCAVFSVSSDDRNNSKVSYEPHMFSYEHDSGRHCFTLTVPENIPQKLPNTEPPIQW